MTKRRITWLIALPILLGGTALVASVFKGPALKANFPTHKLERGAFHVTMAESGEIKAAGGETVISPRIGGRLKIVHLWPEGEQVQIGDLIIQFDPAEFEREMLDDEGEFEKEQAQSAKLKAQREQRLQELAIGIKEQEENVKLQKLNLQMAEFGKPIDLETSKIQFVKAERALANSIQRYESQKIINRVDFEKQQQRIDRRQRRYDRAKENHERTSMYATKPGIVVYRKIWKPGRERSKVAVGDQIWGGRALLEIPDLSRMQVLCMVGEVDLKRVALQQQAFIRLEAFAGPVFQGEVTDIAPMATPQPGADDIQVFEILVDIAEQDVRLKPGMSAQVEIMIETFADVHSVPLGAIFERDGKKMVYCLRDGTFKPVEVELGEHNGIAVMIKSGLEDGDIIALSDPRII